MARDLEDEDYYISRGGKIPIKWSPPEVYTHNTIAICTITHMLLWIYRP